MSCRATLPVLPIEVVEHALDYLRGDAKTLTLCCRVCRVWSSRARYNLFHEVKLHDNNLARFFAAVARDPGAATVMRELTLVGAWDKPKGSPRVLWTTHLRTLRLHYVDLTSPWLPLVTLSAVSSLTELSLKTCGITDAQELVRFLRNLPRLRHFAASDLAMRKRDEALDDDPAEALPALQSLCLSARMGSPLRLLSMLISAPGGLTSLRVLSIKMSTRRLAKLEVLLAFVAENLRELILTVEPDDTWSEDPVSPLSLRACRNLSALSLDVRLCHTDATHEGYLNWVPSLFSSIGAEDLRLVRLVVRAGCAAPGDLADLDWGAIAGALCKARFASVRRVVVRVVNGGIALNKCVGPYVRAQMAAVDRRGILRCVPTGV